MGYFDYCNPGSFILQLHYLSWLKDTFILDHILIFRVFMNALGTLKQSVVNHAQINLSQSEWIRTNPDNSVVFRNYGVGLDKKHMWNLLI